MQSELNVIHDYQRHLRSMELSDNTIVDYTRVLNLFDRWISNEYSVSLASPNDIKGYMVSMYCTSIQPLKISTRSLYLTTLRVFLQWLFNMQYIDHDLSAAIAKLPTASRYLAAHPEEAPDKRGYTPDEIKAMLTCPRHSNFVFYRDRAIIATMLATGLRVSELVSLKISDVITEPEFIYVPRKGTHGQKVAVAMAPTAFPYIMRYIEERERKQKEWPSRHSVELDDPLWVSDRGTPLDRSQICHSLSELQKKVGVPTGTHTLRHTMITEVTKQANPIVARDAAGQKSISVTNRYLHSTQNEIKEAVSLAGSLIDEALLSENP